MMFIINKLIHIIGLPIQNYVISVKSIVGTANANCLPNVASGVDYVSCSILLYFEERDYRKSLC